MIRLIAETAWHHQGDFEFMKNLVSKIVTDTKVDIIKMHITLDFDEYMDPSHDSYTLLKPWLFSKDQWSELINIVQGSGKEIMLLLNDVEAIKFGLSFSPRYVEIHSICLNVPRLQNAVMDYIDDKSIIMIGVGGSTIEEVDQAVNFFSERPTILMFGFQNYPTKYKNINLAKIRKIQSLYPNLEYGYADHTAWNEEDNELITLLGAANNMSYIEKHVTTEYGIDRCDYSAAVSIEMFNSIANKVNILNQISGDGDLSLNDGELQYSQLGPMKMAPYSIKDIGKGSIMKESDFDFIRTSQIGDVTQVNSKIFLGKTLNRDIKKGQVLLMSDFL